MSDAFGVKLSERLVKNYGPGVSAFGLRVSDLYICSASKGRNDLNSPPRGDFKVLASAPKLIVDEELEFH
jgi:hypothetical protein